MVFDLFDQVMLDWDAEEYSKTVTRTVVKDGPPLRTKGKPAVVIPMVITDRKGIIVAWYLPGVLGPHRIVCLSHDILYLCSHSTGRYELCNYGTEEDSQEQSHLQELEVKQSVLFGG